MIYILNSVFVKKVQKQGLNLKFKWFKVVYD